MQYRCVIDCYQGLFRHILAKWANGIRYGLWMETCRWIVDVVRYRGISRIFSLVWWWSLGFIHGLLCQSYGNICLRCFVRCVFGRDADPLERAPPTTGSRQPVSGACWDSNIGSRGRGRITSNRTQSARVISHLIHSWRHKLVWWNQWKCTFYFYAMWFRSRCENQVAFRIGSYCKHQLVVCLMLGKHKCTSRPLTEIIFHTITLL